MSVRALGHGDWTQRHQARLVPTENGGHILFDGDAPGWQVIEFHAQELSHSRLRIGASIRPVAGGDADFCLHHAGNIDVARVTRDGSLRSSNENRLISFDYSPEPEGWLRLTFEVWNDAPMFAMGMARPSSVYTGRGRPQFMVRDIWFEPVTSKWLPSPEDRLTLVDVGAREGLDPAWEPHLPGLRLVMFEPDPTEATRIARSLPPDGGHVVRPDALADVEGRSEFFVTAAIGYSSLLEPDVARLSRYPVADWFRVVRTGEVQTRRYDRLHAEGLVPTPDVVKIDVQGLEYQVLRGFGSLLDNVIAIELEAHLQPIYRNQNLLGDIVMLLDRHGLGLRRMVPQGFERFDRELVEVNAFFTRRTSSVSVRERIACVEDIWRNSRPR